jgi:hypothetical protein
MQIGVGSDKLLSWPGLTGGADMHAEIVKGAEGSLFFWNVDGAVGLNGSNKEDDVLFVQWCLYKLARAAELSFYSNALKAGLMDVPVNGRCDGRESDPLVASIKFLQKEAGQLVDGRVSPATGGHGSYSMRGQKHLFLILGLNNVLRALHPDQYPRLDKMPQFIWRVRQQAIEPFLPH